MNTRTDKILGASLALAAFSFITPSHVQAQTCVIPPTCESLGYTKSESDCAGKQALKCPFDNTKVFCSENTSGDNCTNPKVGYIMYSDMSCSEDVIKDKIPIGVIASLAPNIIIALKDTPYSSDETYNKIPSRCTDYTVHGISGWVMPSKSVLLNIAYNIDIINNTLSKLNKPDIGYKTILGYDNDDRLLDVNMRTKQIRYFKGIPNQVLYCTKYWGNASCAAEEISETDLYTCPEHGICISSTVSNCPYNITKYTLNDCEEGFVPVLQNTDCAQYDLTEDRSQCYQLYGTTKGTLYINCTCSFLDYQNDYLSKYSISCDYPDNVIESYKKSLEKACKTECAGRINSGVYK